MSFEDRGLRLDLGSDRVGCILNVPVIATCIFQVVWISLFIVLRNTSAFLDFHFLVSCALIYLSESILDLIPGFIGDKNGGSDCVGEISSIGLVIWVAPLVLVCVLFLLRILLLICRELRMRAFLIKSINRTDKKIGLFVLERRA